MFAIYCLLFVFNCVRLPLFFWSRQLCGLFFCIRICTFASNKILSFFTCHSPTLLIALTLCTPSKCTQMCVMRKNLYFFFGGRFAVVTFATCTVGLYYVRYVILFCVFESSIKANLSEMTDRPNKQTKNYKK